MRVIYILPEDSPLRQRLKEPLGEIISEEELSEIMENVSIIAVGDACLASTLKYGEPLVGIYDGKVERKLADKEITSKIESWKVRKLSVENPRGTITEDAMKTLKDVLKLGEKVKIEVAGEEDLLALPAIIYANENMQICYGQPGVGIVLVTPDEKIKETARKILKEMRT